MLVQWLNIALNSLGRISIESLERVFPLEVRGVVSRRFEVGNTAGEYTVCGSSPHFRLGRGRPQGDNISPNTFNFADQILIFKLELDPVVKKIPRVNPVITNNVHSFFSQESNRETDKNESLADDNTTLTLLEEASLMKVKKILNDFGAFSGLLCNFDKSCVMPTSPPSPEDIQIIERTGFELTDNLTLLGMNIRPDLQNTDEIFEKIATKIINMASFWERFKLSIPGRITIAKTFMVSQLNYIGCFLEPSDAILDRIQLILDNFVKKILTLQVPGSKSRRRTVVLECLI
jgi:hypothetical protein